MTQEVIIPVNSDGQFLNGSPIPLASLPLAIAYSGDFLSTITIEYFGNTYVQTFTNNGSNITDISAFVLQA